MAGSDLSEYYRPATEEGDFDIFLPLAGLLTIPSIPRLVEISDHDASANILTRQKDQECSKRGVRANGRCLCPRATPN